jgi:hypothetical protein
MTRFLLIASLFALAVPAAFAAPPSGQGKPQPSTTTPSAAELCKQQRRTIGMSAFRALYAPTGTPKAAMDACLAKQVQTTSSAAKNAAMECKAEQADPGFAAAHGGKTFAEYYGANANGKNAFGKCVSSKATAQVNAQQSATLNAAKKCKAERAQIGDSQFAAKYGTNKNKRNAFGKCVSKLAKGTSG